MNRLLALALCTVFLISCGGSGEERRDPVAASRLKAAELSEMADRAYEKGSYELALRYYSEAFRLSRSVEDFDSMAVGAINTASVLRALGRFEEADELLNKLLDNDYLIDIPGIEAEARYIKALTLLEQGDAVGAVAQSVMAMEACRKNCIATARIHNLSARAYFEASDMIQARKQAEAGLDASRKDDDVREEANALRLLAGLDEAEGRYDESTARYKQALELDKKLALGPKIFYDLMGLGRAALEVDKAELAVGYFERARDVAEALGDEGNVQAARDAIGSLHESK